MLLKITYVEILVGWHKEPQYLRQNKTKNIGGVEYKINQEQPQNYCSNNEAGL